MYCKHEFPKLRRVRTYPYIDLRNIRHRNARGGATSLIAGPNAGRLQISSFGGEASILSVKLS